MDYQQSLDYLYGLQRFGIKLGLDNMRALTARMPELREPLRAVHVAGTNGKGSVCAFLAAILQNSGLRVGLYTSPHLQCFTERIRIDGRAVTKDYAAALATTIRARSAGLPLTFFEATTAMALLAFQEQRVDVAVVETGMGGRLDATNILTPLVSVITPISHDHRQHLGNSLIEIAGEKAGVIKAEVPVVIGRQAPEVTDFLEEVALQRSSPVLLAQRDYAWQGGHASLAVSMGDEVFPGLSCRLEGEHQLDNYAQAIAAAVQLGRFGVSVTVQAVRRAGLDVAWPGRLEWWRVAGRSVLLDAAHNAAGARCLASYLEQQGQGPHKVVFGLSGEREPGEVLSPLLDVLDGLYLVPLPGVDGVPPEKIKGWAASRHLRCRVFASPEEGLAAALIESGTTEPVVVCGSIYLVGALQSALRENRIGLSTVVDSVA